MKREAAAAPPSPSTTINNPQPPRPSNLDQPTTSNTNKPTTIPTTMKTEPGPLCDVRRRRPAAPLPIVRTHRHTLSLVASWYIIHRMPLLLTHTLKHTLSQSLYPASRVTSGPAAKGNNSNSNSSKEAPRGVVGSLELLQAKQVSPQVSRYLGRARAGVLRRKRVGRRCWWCN